MLRRVTPEQVAVFVATSASFTATLRVRPSSSTSTNDWINVPASQSPQSPVQLGGSLYVLVITWTPPAALTVDLVYEYDVQFKVAPGVKVLSDAGDELPGTPQTFGLSELGLLAEPRHVGFNAGAFPSFAIQSSLAKLRVIHGSCRKPHGGGDDAMPFITKLFGTSASDRPHYLLLTGDQIYADDVSTSLLWLLQQTGKELMGRFTETLTLPTWEEGEVTFPGATQQSAGVKRQKLMANFKQVSSGSKDSHLVFLAEFYAMYVVVWSPALWGWGWGINWKPQDLTTPGQAADALDEYNQLAEDNTWPSQELERHKFVRRFSQGTSKVRRVLANVSTLMMFDDHEVSDDWNLDQNWNQDSRSDPMVHRIIRNALLAFAAFQAWGNDPARFATGTVGRKLLNAANPATSTKDNIFDTPAYVDTLLRLGPWGSSPTPSTTDTMLWHWAIDWGGFEYRILALDTRTRRAYTPKPTGKDTGLLDSAALDDQLPVNDLSSADEKVTFVLSPAPVMGYPLLEEVIQPLLKVVSDDAARAADAEAWALSRGSLVALLHRLSKYGRVVLLSGDVHYSYSNYTDFRTRNEGGLSSSARSARLVQLCSSALHNEEAKTLAVEQAGLVEMQVRRWSGRQFPSFDDHMVGSKALENRLREKPNFHKYGPIVADKDRIERVIKAATSGHMKYEFTLENLIISACKNNLLRSLISDKLYTTTPEKLTLLYFLALQTGVPEAPKAGTDGRYSLTLPTGPWFSEDLRKAISQTLPSPSTTETAWVWTWTTTFVQRQSTGNQPSSGFVGRFFQGQTAKMNEIVGRPNFGEVTLEPLRGGPIKLRHRIHLIDAKEMEVETVIHIIPDLIPDPTDEDWPEVYK
jgi:hypothetical protein